MLLKHSSDHKSTHAYANAHAHIPIYWNLQKYCNACGAQNYRPNIHVRTTRTPKHDWIGGTHTESESDWGREREANWTDCHCFGWMCLPVVTNWARACCCCYPAQRELNSSWSSPWLTLSRHAVGTFCCIVLISAYNIIHNIKFSLSR